MNYGMLLHMLAYASVLYTHHMPDHVVHFGLAHEGFTRIRSQDHELTCEVHVMPI